MTQRQIIVVGGGLAGLTAAAVAARSGAEVTLLEARSRPGGRARSEQRARGAIFNEGPHALYAGLAGWRELEALGIGPSGGQPSAHAFGRWRGRIDRLPGTTLDAVRTRLVGSRAKFDLAKLLADPKRALRGDLSGSLADWIDRATSDESAAALLAMVGRTATYMADPTKIAAEAAVPQIVAGITDGVRYLDGGWEQLVDSLRACAERAGAKLHSDAKAERVSNTDGRWTVLTSSGEHVGDAAIIASGGPRGAQSLLGDLTPATGAWAESIAPITMASLDLHLASIPVPARQRCFALDAPIYYSIHTPTARLATSGEVAHVAWYGECDADTEATLEAFCDEVQPGWRERVLDRRFGRRLVTTHGVPTPESGFAGRPGPAVPDCPGLYVAGDWVGSRGLLADASIASGADAARMATT